MKTNTDRPAWWPTESQKLHADAGCAHPDRCNINPQENPMKATHKKSGHIGEIQDVTEGAGGLTIYYFEDHQRPTVAGWYHLGDLSVPGVNA